MSLFETIDGNIKYPIFPIYGNVQADEEFYIASIIFPYNIQQNKILYESISPRLYFLSIQSFFNNSFGFTNDIKPFPPSTCNLTYNDTTGQNTPPFSFDDFIFTENKDKSTIFKTNSLYSKNVKLQYKENDKFNNILANSFSSNRNSDSSELFSKNNLFRYSSFDLYSDDDKITSTCQELYNFVFIPKEKDRVYIQGLNYTGIPMIIYYGSKKDSFSTNTYYPMHSRYLLTCSTSLGCNVSNTPSQQQLNTCYHLYSSDEVKFICNNDLTYSSFSSNDISRNIVKQEYISNNNMDFLNYYFIPKTIYDIKGNPVSGMEVAISYYDYLLGRVSSFRENDKYFTKSLVENGLPNTTINFAYCTNDEYLTVNKDTYGCNFCFSISRNRLTNNECQCVFNPSNTNLNYFQPGTKCTKYQNCYCDFPQNYVNEKGFISCGDKCKNCTCDSQDITKRCNIELCSYYDFYVKDQPPEQVNNKNLYTLWILIGVGILVFIIIMGFLVTTLTKKSTVYRTETINIDVLK